MFTETSTGVVKILSQDTITASAPEDVKASLIKIRDSNVRIIINFAEFKSNLVIFQLAQYDLLLRSLSHASVLTPELSGHWE